VLASDSASKWLVFHRGIPQPAGTGWGVPRCPVQSWGTLDAWLCRVTLLCPATLAGCARRDVVDRGGI